MKKNRLVVYASKFIAAQAFLLQCLWGCKNEVQPKIETKYETFPMYWSKENDSSFSFRFKDHPEFSHTIKPVGPEVNELLAAIPEGKPVSVVFKLTLYNERIGKLEIDRIDTLANLRWYTTGGTESGPGSRSPWVRYR